MINFIFLIAFVSICIIILMYDFKIEEHTILEKALSVVKDVLLNLKGVCLLKHFDISECFTYGSLMISAH